MGDNITIGVIDYHELSCLGVQYSLIELDNFKVVGSGKNINEAFQIAEQQAPSIIIIDLNYPGASLNCIQKLCLSFPRIHFVILTANTSKNFFLSCFKAGIKGYISKSISSLQLPNILHKIYQGEKYADPVLASHTISTFIDMPIDEKPKILSSLTNREVEVLLKVAKGMKNKEIALDMQITERTVKYYMTNIMQKLNVKNRLEAAMVFKTSQNGEIMNSIN